MTYEVKKTFGHNEGLSCCFRQWRADSHCNLLHGYALGISFIFKSKSLDSRNWVVDFGGFKDIKKFLHEWFDHTTLIAKDDPELKTFQQLNDKNLINLKIIDDVGCEKFAEFIFKELVKISPMCEVFLSSVAVREHMGNSAIYTNQFGIRDYMKIKSYPIVR